MFTKVWKNIFPNSNSFKEMSTSEKGGQSHPKPSLFSRTLPKVLLTKVDKINFTGITECLKD